MFDFDKKIQDLKEISPEILEFLTNQEYIKYAQSEDEITEDFIINYCCNILIQELSEIGIFFHCDLAELLSNNFNTNYIIWLYKFMKINPLIKYLQINKPIVRFIETEIDEISDNEVVINMLQRIYNISEDEETKNSCMFLIDKAYSSHVFSNLFLKRVYELYKQINTEEVEINELYLKSFYKYYKTLMEKKEKTIDTIVDKNILSINSVHNMETYMNSYFLNNLINNTSVFSSFLNWFHYKNSKTDDNILEPYIKDWKEKYKTYSMSSDDHILYYKINKLVPNKDKILIMVLTIILEKEIAPYPIEEVYTKTINILRVINENSYILFNKIWTIFKENSI